MPPRLRSDAMSSVARIVSAARSAFAEGDGGRSLDQIAKQAGVGIATLYRHFPNRHALAKAVFDEIFDTEVEPLLSQLAGSDAPRDGLLNVVERISQVVVREAALSESLGSLPEASLEFLRPRAQAFAPMVAAAQAAGNLRQDLTPEDVPVLLAAMISISPAIGREPAARRRYHALFLDALNPTKAEPLPPA